MRERRVHQLDQLKQRGLPYLIPETYAFATPDRPIGRFIIPGVTPDNDPGLTFAEAMGRTDVVWVPPSQTIATRKFSFKSMSSVRGSTVDIARNRVLIFESILEYYLANMLMAQRSIVNIEDQPAALKYEFDGIEKHTLDFLSDDWSGVRIGYNVKPSHFLEKDQTMERVKAMRKRYVPRSFHNILVITEKQLHRDKGLNAIDINDARRSRCQVECDFVLDQLRGIGTPIKLWKLQNKLADSGGVWNAVLCLHFDGLVNIRHPAVRFSDECWVQATTRH
jgi:hypothetical protein